VTLRGTLRHQRLRLPLSSAVCVATGVLFRARAEGLPAERGFGASCSASSRARQDVAFEAMKQPCPAAGGRDHPTTIRTSTPAMSFVGASGQSPSLNRGRITITSSRSKNKKKTAHQNPKRPQAADQWCASCVQALPVRGPRCSCRNVPAIRIGASFPQRPYQYVMRSATIEELTSGAGDRAEAEDAAGLVTSRATWQNRAARGDRRDRAREASALGDVGRKASDGAQQSLRRAQGVDDSIGDHPVWVTSEL